MAEKMGLFHRHSVNIGFSFSILLNTLTM